MSVKITDKDHGFKALSARVKSLAKGHSLSVGIHAKDGQKTYPVGSPLSVLQIAVIHEFGLGVPERSFIRAYFTENEPRLLKMVSAVAKEVAKGTYSEKVGLERLGQQIVAEIQVRISQRIPPPLAQSTIDRKGSDVPLIDTGQLRSSITYKVDGE